MTPRQQNCCTHIALCIDVVGEDGAGRPPTIARPAPQPLRLVAFTWPLPVAVATELTAPATGLAACAAVYVGSVDQMDKRFFFYA